jgi:hypothetical protein
VKLLQELHAVHVRHLEVADDQRGRVVRHTGQRFNAVSRQIDLVALLLQQFAETVTGGGLVVYDQNSYLAHDVTPSLCSIGNAI